MAKRIHKELLQMECEISQLGDFPELLFNCLVTSTDLFYLVSEKNISAVDPLS
jgi:hypothetical protein